MLNENTTETEFRVTLLPSHNLFLPLEFELPVPLAPEEQTEPTTDEAFCERWNEDHDNGVEDHPGIWGWDGGGLLSFIGLFEDA